MPAIIKCLGIAGDYPCDHIGQYLKACDFEANDGRGLALFTRKPQQAMKFPDTGAAMQYWNTQSKTVPLRPDGQPNRPLTAYHVEITYTGGLKNPKVKR